MARFKVLAQSWINNRMYNEGDIVEWDGEPGWNLEALDAPVKSKLGKTASVDVSEDPPL